MPNHLNDTFDMSHDSGACGINEGGCILYRDGRTSFFEELRQGPTASSMADKDDTLCTG